MKVREVMMGTPYFCTPDNNLGVAAEMMWNANCGFLPIQSSEGQVIGVVTDRDVCIALCTRNRLPGDISVQEVMTSTLYSCSPEEDIHVALQTMREGKVRRLPVVAENGALVGVISMDDVLLRTEPIGLGKEPELPAMRLCGPCVPSRRDLCLNSPSKKSPRHDACHSEGCRVSLNFMLKRIKWDLPTDADCQGNERHLAAGRGKKRPSQQLYLGGRIHRLLEAGPGRSGVLGCGAAEGREPK